MIERKWCGQKELKQDKCDEYGDWGLDEDENICERVLWVHP